MIKTIIFTFFTIRFSFTTSFSRTPAAHSPNEIKRHRRTKNLEGYIEATDDVDIPIVKTSIAELNELGRMAAKIHRDEVREQFDIDNITSFVELNEVSRTIGGPHYDERTPSLEFGKDRRWFEMDRAGDDIEGMCMSQITDIMTMLGEEGLEEVMTIVEAHDLVWSLANVHYEDYKSTDVEQVNKYWGVIYSIVELKNLSGSHVVDRTKDDIYIDEITSIAELNMASRTINGPQFDERRISLEDAKDQLWDFEEDRAKDDIDEMSMKELRDLMIEFGGGEFDEGITLEEARDLVWSMAHTFSEDYNSTHVEQSNANWEVMTSVEEFEEGTTLEEARNLVWDLANSFSEDYNSTDIDQRVADLESTTPIVEQGDRRSHIDVSKNDSSTPPQEEFDIDEITSIVELNDVSRKVGGPIFNVRTSSLEAAKNRLWDFEENRAKDDIDEMCMKELTGIMKQLGRGHFVAGTTLKEARNLVWALAQNFGADYRSTYVANSYRKVMY